MNLYDIYWANRSWRFANSATKTEQPGDFETLDSAIRAAHAAGFNVRSVSMTRGAVAERTEEKKA